MLVRCLYASRAAAPSPATLDAILSQSRRNNLARGITGLLCTTPDTFVQVLEGGRDPVCELYNAIVRDDRHTGVRMLVFEEIGERQFGGWSMGQVNVSGINPALLLKYGERATLDPFAAPGRATLALLAELVATGSITGRAA